MLSIPKEVFFLLLSAVVFVFVSLYYLYQLRKKKRKSLNHKLFVPTIGIFISVFLHRLIISFYEINTQSHYALVKKEDYDLMVEILHGIVRTMQTFSLDEDYQEAIYIGRELFLYEINSTCLSEFYGVFAALLNVCAPVIVAAFLMGVLTNFFPRLKLSLNFWKVKYVFSELNEKAIYLAEDIIKIAEKKKNSQKFFKRFAPLPLIIFTDAYIDHESEASSELLYRAKEIGAVCIKDDILKKTFSKINILYYFLIDEIDINNIHALSALATNELLNRKNRCYIYTFSQNPEASNIIKKLNREDKLLRSNLVIKVVQEYTSIVYNLLNEIPLYYPLLSKYSFDENDAQKELEVTIIGGGNIGTEAFLGVFWCGQMLNCRLKINVVVKDAKKFISKIHLLNPDILNSGVVFEDTNPAGLPEKNNELLRVFKNKEIFAEPYAYFRFYSTDMTSNDFFEEQFPLLSSDFFIIALGSDEMNMSIAARIDKIVRRKILDGKLKNLPIIAYSVYDSKTNSLLNKLDFTSENMSLYAFASLENIYCCKNIFMDMMSEPAFNISNMHSQKAINYFLNDEYTWWSDIARALHIKYKVYSVGLIGTDRVHDQLSEDVLKAYKDKIGDENINIELSWLEHRRWNAFMRTKGFNAPSENQMSQYAFKNNVDDHKQLDLKLHPCIVERAKSSNEQVIDLDDDDFLNNQEYDLLDMASIKVYQMRKKRTGEIRDAIFKKHDNPLVDIKD